MSSRAPTAAPRCNRKARHRAAQNSIYGGWAAATALICLLAGAGVILVLWLLLSLLERWINESE